MSSLGFCLNYFLCNGIVLFPFLFCYGHLFWVYDPLIYPKCPNSVLDDLRQYYLLVECNCQKVAILTKVIMYKREIIKEI